MHTHYIDGNCSNAPRTARLNPGKTQQGSSTRIPEIHIYYTIMNQRLSKIKALRRNSVVFFGQCTWFPKNLYSKSVYGTEEQFKLRFHRGVVKSVSRHFRKRPLKVEIYFEAYNQNYSFRLADLMNEEQYYFEEDDLPENAVIVENEMDEAELFPSLSLISEIEQTENECIEDLKSFKRKILEAGIHLRKFEEDIEELCDRGSKFFFCSDEDERQKRLRETPQPLVLVPLEENRDFFL